MFFFDLETVPDFTVPEDIRPRPKLGVLKDPEKIKKREAEYVNKGLIKDMSVDPTFNKIVCASFLLHDGTMDTIVDDEVAILKRFWELADHYPSVVGFNIFHFDLPTIRFRSLVHKVQPTCHISTRKYQNDPVCDLAMILCAWDMRNLKKLDFYLRRLGIPAKIADGSMVYEWYNEKKGGGLDKIAEYNREEVKSIKLLHERLTNYY